MDESALKTYIDCLNGKIDALHGWDHFWTACLIVGCMFEVIFVCREYLDDKSDWHDARTRGVISPPKKPPIRWLSVEMLGVVLVLVGIGGELRVNVQAGDLETKVRGANSNLVLLLEQKVGDAKTSAEAAARAAKDAQGAADAVDARATKINREFDVFEVEIDKSLFAWRISLSRQFSTTGNRVLNPITFESTLKGKPKGHVEVWANIKDGEAHALSFDIWSALKRSGWDAGATIHPLPPERTALMGSLAVRCHPWNPSSHSLFKPRTAVESLLAALAWGIERPSPASGFWIQEPDASLPNGHCVVEVYAQTADEKKYNSNPSAIPR